jgi:hypothetical protein
MKSTTKRQAEEPGADIEQQTVLRTPAGTAQVAKPAGARSSVFDIARPPPGTSKTGGVRPRLPVLDAAALVVKRGVPKPIPHKRGPGAPSVYAPVLDALTEPGMSIELPIAYKGAVYAYAKKLAKRDPRRFSVQAINETTCGLWRDE